MRDSDAIKQLVAYLAKRDLDEEAPFSEIESDTPIKLLRGFNDVPKSESEILLSDCEACGLFDVDRQGEKMKLRDLVRSSAGAASRKFLILTCDVRLLQQRVWISETTGVNEVL